MASSRRRSPSVCGTSPPEGGGATSASRPPSPEELLAPLERFGIRPGLEAIRAILAGLGDPQRRVPSVLVAGTNGKGSTACMLAAAVSGAGYRVGLFTSPHLESVTERIRVDGAAIAAGELGTRVERVLGAARRAAVPLTYFEALTAAACLHFAERRTDLAVLEVGLGGRLDATNAVDPVLGLVCEIARDHEAYLGDSLAEIAREKAGILRRERPALFWDAVPEVRSALAAAARERGARLVRAADEVEVRVAEDDAGRVELRAGGERVRLRPPLPGRHQWANLGLAFAAARRLAASGWPGVDAPRAWETVAACSWPGRLEEVAIDAGRRVLLDAAHNPSSSAALADHLEARGGRTRLLFGALRTKDAAAMLPRLAGAAGEIVLTRPPGAEAWPPTELERFAGRRALAIEESAERALEAALTNGFDTLVVCGSIYLVGAVRASLRRRFGAPAPASQPLWPPPLNRRR